MRILFVSDVPADPNSGAAGTEYQTILALRAGGHDVDAIWADGMPRRITHPNLHYLLELPGSFARAIREACIRKTYDVIHCNQPHAFLAAREHRSLGRPGVFVNRSHGFETHVMAALGDWRNRWGLRERRFPRNLPGAVIDAGVRRHCRLVLRYANGLIVSSGADRSYVLSCYNVAADRVALIPQAAPEAYRMTPVRAQTPERLRRLLFVGPSIFIKGPNVLGAAVSALLAIDPGLTFTWVCARDEQRLAASHITAQVLSRVLFQDPMPQKELLDCYDRHGVFLFPSLFEGFGKAFLEAMARGLCVVASNTGGMADVITSGRDGVLVPAGDSVALADAVRGLVGRPDWARAIAAEARQTALDYSWTRVGHETAEFYQSLLSMRHRAVPPLSS
ncbi:glycosyltransferase family 4 protein [Thiocapsa roseopersicina]|uniref:glycosyltransferase family 4 protein n=1 Tax=Thiocapsa roseopersicina TaxID=1058 RepID=UPI000B87D803|nr:glycosyltransferase family 4 protein [Thiocapsa roseopersicina]